MWIYPQYHEVHSNHNPVPMIWLLKRQGPRWPVLLCTTTTVLLKSKNIYRYMYKWMSLHCPCICMAVKFWIMETFKGCCFFHVHIGKSLAKAFLQDFLGPTLWAPCSEQTVCSSFRPFNIICLKHIFSLLVQSGSYFMHQQSLWVKCAVTLKFHSQRSRSHFSDHISPLDSILADTSNKECFLGPIVTKLFKSLNSVLNLIFA